jgi:glutamyl-Q tRNA(Asp) synthetase
VSIRTRFAPSPTGRLHLGHALAAVVARDLSASVPGGAFLLRFEDIDASRVRPEWFVGIEEDLRWLGLQWHGEPLRQSMRGAAYQAALDALHALGVLYPCFCTRGEIRRETERMPAAPHGDEGPPYPGTCRRLPTAERADKIAAGVAHAWRLDVRAAAAITGPLQFTDLRFGTIEVDPLRSGDVVLARKDVGVAYHLAVVVDDAFQSITHVTRGEDLLGATHIHRLLQALLGCEPPVWLHHRLVCDDHGNRLAKRHDALSLRALRESGATPEDVLRRIR